MLTSWQFEKDKSSSEHQFCIGYFDAGNKSLRVLCELEAGITEVVQASINSSRNLLAYVVKGPLNKACDSEEESCYYYMAKITELRDGIGAESRTWPLLNKPSRYQVMVQFLWRLETSSAKIPDQDKLLVMVHRQSKIVKIV